MSQRLVGVGVDVVSRPGRPSADLQLDIVRGAG
jgi:hypothetical protein